MKTIKLLSWSLIEHNIKLFVLAIWYVEKTTNLHFLNRFYLFYHLIWFLLGKERMIPSNERKFKNDKFTHLKSSLLVLSSDLISTRKRENKFFKREKRFFMKIIKLLSWLLIAHNIKLFVLAIWYVEKMTNLHFLNRFYLFYHLIWFLLGKVRTSPSNERNFKKRQIYTS